MAKTDWSKQVELKVGDYVRLTEDMSHGRRDSKMYSLVTIKAGTVGRVILVNPDNKTYLLRMVRFLKGKREWKDTAVTTYIAFPETDYLGPTSMCWWEKFDLLDMLAAIPKDKEH